MKKLTESLRDALIRILCQTLIIFLTLVLSICFVALLAKISSLTNMI